MSIAFVTGGSGYLGRNLIRALVGGGEQVRALARSDAAAAAVTALGAEPVRADLMDRRDYAEGLRGCHVIYHCAAEVGEWGPRDRFWRVNVEGTQALLDAARAASVPRFVHTSTEAVYANGGPMKRIPDDWPLPKDPLPRYPETKGAAEKRVLAANGPELATMIVRPRFIWGGDDTTLLPKLCQAARTGRLQWIDGGRYPTSTTHVDNVVEGLWLAATKGQGGHTYFVTDGEPVEFRSFVTDLLATQGVKAPKKEISWKVAWPMARAMEWAWEHLPLPGDPPISRMPLALIGQEVTVLDENARHDLGYVGKTTREAGLQELREMAEAARR